MPRPAKGANRRTFSFTLYSDGIEKLVSLEKMLNLSTTDLIRKLIDEEYDRQNPEVHLKRLEAEQVRISEAIAATREAIPKWHQEKERRFYRVRYDSFLDYHRAVWADRSEDGGPNGKSYMRPEERLAWVADAYGKGKVNGFDTPEEAFKWFEGKVEPHLVDQSRWADMLASVPEDERKNLRDERWAIYKANRNVESIESGKHWLPKPEKLQSQMRRW